MAEILERCKRMAQAIQTGEHTFSSISLLIDNLEKQLTDNQVTFADLGISRQDLIQKKTKLLVREFLAKFKAYQDKTLELSTFKGIFSAFSHSLGKGEITFSDQDLKESHFTAKDFFSLHHLLAEQKRSDDHPCS